MVCTITAWSARALFYSQFCCKLQQNWTRLFAYSLGNPKSPMYLSSSEGKSVSVISTEERLNKGNSFIGRKIIKIVRLDSRKELTTWPCLPCSTLLRNSWSSHNLSAAQKRNSLRSILRINIIKKTYNKAEHTFHWERKFEFSSCG